MRRRPVLLVAALAALLVTAAPAGASISLRHDAQRAGLRVGMAPSRPPWYPGFSPLLARQANVVTFENAAKWAAVHPSRKRYDFRAADRMARWARDHGMTMRGHNLVWHVSNPAWLQALHPTRAEAIRLLREHITTVVSHFRTRYPGLVKQWDVVNEGIGNDARRRQSVWQRWIGDDYVAIAFRAARAAAGPGVRLYYNDYFDDALMHAAEATSAAPVTVAEPGATGALGCAAVPKCRAVQRLVRARAPRADRRRRLPGPHARQRSLRPGRARRVGRKLACADHRGRHADRVAPSGRLRPAGPRRCGARRTRPAHVRGLGDHRPVHGGRLTAGGP